MDYNLAVYNKITLGVSNLAIAESVQSNLPGREDGPADAYRHLLLSAELTRSYGEDYARSLLDGHEWTGNLDGQTPEAEAMDIHNNNLGVGIGKTARSWEEVVQKVRELIDPGNGNGGGARWLPSDYWKTNPRDDETGERIPTGDPRLNWPPSWVEGPYTPSNNVGARQRIFNNDDFNYDDIRKQKIKIKPAANTAYRASQRNGSPLILDLDGDGIEISQLSTSAPILFDLNADGLRTGMAWAGADDGFLALDRNGNGTIDSGRELFGDNTLLANGQKAADGYVALADLDSNHDGKIDAGDTQFANLRLWHDLNQDGVSAAGELLTLAQAGITQTGLSKTASTQTLADGTRLDGTASFTINGQSRNYTDAWLAENPFYSEFTDSVAVSDAVKPLPQMRGSGAVRDLREAATLSSTLQGVLAQFQQATTRETQYALIDPLLKAWADTSSLTTVTEWEAAGHVVTYTFYGQDAATVPRLKLSLEQIDLAVGESGMALDFSALGRVTDARYAANDAYWRRVA